MPGGGQGPGAHPLQRAVSSLLHFPLASRCVGVFFLSFFLCGVVVLLGGVDPPQFKGEQRSDPVWLGGSPLGWPLFH